MEESQRKASLEKLSEGQRKTLERVLLLVAAPKAATRVDTGPTEAAPVRSLSHAQAEERPAEQKSTVSSPAVKPAAKPEPETTASVAQEIETQSVSDPGPPARPAPSALDMDHAGAFGFEEGEELGVSKAIRGAVDEFKALDYNFLVPVGKLFSSSLLKRKAVRWVLLFGLLPLVFFQLHLLLEFSFSDSIWLIELYFCLFWALYFYSIIQPTARIWRRALGYATFTVFVGIPLLYLAQTLPVVSRLYETTGETDFRARVIGFVLGVGLLEESCKALPLLWFGLRRGKIASVREGVFLGLMSGLGFAAAEGVDYTVRATVMAHAYGAVAEQFMQFLFRLMSGPVLHGAWAGTVGWFIGVAAVRPKKRWPTVALGLCLMAALHGLYDVFSGNILGLALAAVTFIVFMAYLGHGDEIEKQSSVASALSVVPERNIPSVVGATPLTPVTNIRSHLPFSIVVTVLGFLPFGVFALVHSLKVRGKVRAGDCLGARAASARAWRWCWASLATGIVIVLMGIVASGHLPESLYGPAPLTVQAANQVGEQMVLAMQERGFSDGNKPDPKVWRDMLLTSFHACGYDFVDTLEAIAERPLHAQQNGGWLALILGATEALESEEAVRAVYTAREAESISRIRNFITHLDSRSKPGAGPDPEVQAEAERLASRSGRTDGSFTEAELAEAKASVEERTRLKQELDEEASRLAKEYWDSSVIACGNSVFYLVDGSSTTVIEGKGQGNITTEGELGNERSQADILNGLPDIAWTGHTQLSFPVWRSGWLQEKGIYWNEWREGNFSQELSLSKENGQWKFQKLLAIDCSRLQTDARAGQ